METIVGLFAHQEDADQVINELSESELGRMKSWANHQAKWVPL
jgi:hypothetical protein